LARRRHGGRTAWASALGFSLAVHGLLLWVALTPAPVAHRPLETPEPVQPFLIDLEPPPPPPEAKATTSSGSSAPATHAAAPVEAGEPAQIATGQQPAGAAAAPSSALGAGTQPQATLKFDCMETSRRGRDPCLFRNAPRDKLPEDVIRQASIDADKAEYYDRVLDARERMRNDFNYGNTAMFTCKIGFGGGQPAHVKKIPHSLKLGRLPCFLVPPHGSLTPDIFVEPIPPKNPGGGPP
jgi:hypothetical protein